MAEGRRESQLSHVVEASELEVCWASPLHHLMAFVLFFSGWALGQKEGQRV